jgi:hypothetical protein
VKGAFGGVQEIKIYGSPVEIFKTLSSSISCFGCHNEIIL